MKEETEIKRDVNFDLFCTVLDINRFSRLLTVQRHFQEHDDDDADMPICNYDSVKVCKEFDSYIKNNCL